MYTLCNHKHSDWYLGSTDMFQQANTENFRLKLLTADILCRYFKATKIFSPLILYISEWKSLWKKHLEHHRTLKLSTEGHIHLCQLFILTMQQEILGKRQMCCIAGFNNFLTKQRSERNLHLHHVGQRRTLADTAMLNKGKVLVMYRSEPNSHHDTLFIY